MNSETKSSGLLKFWIRILMRELYKIRTIDLQVPQFYEHIRLPPTESEPWGAILTCKWADASSLLLSHQGGWHKLLPMLDSAMAGYVSSGRGRCQGRKEARGWHFMEEGDREQDCWQASGEQEAEPDSSICAGS